MAKRPYDDSDVKEIYDNIGADISSWDDVLVYLNGPAKYDADFAQDEVGPMIDDFQKLKKDGDSFTQDYREAWKMISGEEAKGKPQKLKKHPWNPIAAQRTFEDLKFPADKKTMIAHARDKGVSDSVVGLLEKVDQDQFDNLGSMIEEIGDKAWDHD